MRHWLKQAQSQSSITNAQPFEEEDGKICVIYQKPLRGAHENDEMTEKTLSSSHIFHSKSEPPKCCSMCKHITFLECSDGEAEIVSTTTLSKNQNEIDLLAVDLPALYQSSQGQVSATSVSPPA